MSQGELGNLAGLHATAIGLIERGERGTRTETLVKLAGALEVDPGELLAGITWVSGSYRPGAFIQDQPKAASKGR
jgi:transcriptional regulator with XRE-family HTH domain